MDDNGIGDKTGYLGVQGLIESFGDSAVSEEIVLFVEVSEAEGEEGDYGDDWHASAESQAHENQRKNFSIIALYFELFGKHFFLHLSLDLLALSPASRNFFIEAVENRHAQSRMEDQNDGVEENLVANGDIPIRDEIRVFAHAVSICFQSII